jgi:hypothetical protein
MSDTWFSLPAVAGEHFWSLDALRFPTVLLEQAK